MVGAEALAQRVKAEGIGLVQPGGDSFSSLPVPLGRARSPS